MEIICCGNPTFINHLCDGKCVWEQEVSQLPFFPFCIFANFDLEFQSYWVKLFLVRCSKTFKYLCVSEHQLLSGVFFPNYSKYRTMTMKAENKIFSVPEFDCIFTTSTQYLSSYQVHFNVIFKVPAKIIVISVQVNIHLGHKSVHLI